VVCKAVHRPTGLRYAIKSYNKSNLVEASKKDAAEREVKLLSSLEHPNIIKLHRTIEAED
jgi:serine/threonine protein kinase